MAETYDVMIIGLGAMGSAAAYHLAPHCKVLGLDAYYIGHDFGSSHGQTRIIRQAYFESPAYVKLVQRSYKLWRDLEEESNSSLMKIVGCLNIGFPDTAIVTDALASVKEHDLQYEYLNSREINSYFSCFNLPDEAVAVYEPTAGFLHPEDCINAHLEGAQKRGAVLHFREPVLNWSVEGGEVSVKTAHGDYVARKLIMATGAWSGQLLADLNLPLSVMRVYNVFFDPQNPLPYSPENCPVYIWDFGEGIYYGIPVLPGQGMKFGRHDTGKYCSPYTVKRYVKPREIEALTEEIERYMPGSATNIRSSKICMYTMTPDKHFIVDFHPEYPEVLIAAGFSGHGFKFSSALGEVLKDLALTGQTDQDIGFLSANRFSEGEKINVGKS